MWKNNHIRGWENNRGYKKMRRLVLFARVFFINKRSLIAYIFLSLLFAIPFFVSTISAAFVNYCKTEAEKIFGRFDNILFYSSVDEISHNCNYQIDANVYIDYYGTISVEEEADNTIIGTADNNAKTLGNIHVINGEFPQNKDEICICESLFYEDYSDCEIGSVIVINDQHYRLSGIINDFDVAWNKPPDDFQIQFPNAIVCLSSGGNEHKEIILIKNKYTFPEFAYDTNRNLVANTNVILGNAGAKYNVPDFAFKMLYASIILLGIYILLFTGWKDNKNMLILKGLGLTHDALRRVRPLKCLFLFMFSATTGLLIGIVAAKGFIAIYNINRSSTILYPDNNNPLNCIIACVILGLISSVSYLALEQIVEKKTSIETGKTKRKTLRIKQYYVSELIRDYKSILFSSIVVTIMLITVLFLGIYMKLYVAAKGDVFGKMPIDFDYQFCTDLNMRSFSYVNSSGDNISVRNLPDEDTVYYMPSHSNTIDNNTILEMTGENGIEKVDNYIEAGDVYLAINNNNLNSIYFEGFPDDTIISDKVANDLELNVQFTTYRNSLLCGFPESEIIKLEQYVREGNIDIDKINAGEEIVLVVPVYELEEYGEGFCTQRFIEYEEYNDKKNQFIDHTFHVGDTIELIQILPKDNQLMGCLNSSQLSNDAEVKRITVTIGAIVYERVMWFEDASQMPTAYTFIGTADSFNNFEFEPTFSRTQLYLDDKTDYVEFEPIIHKYQSRLSEFIYKNNAAELKEYRQFMLLLNGMCYLLMGISFCVMLIVSLAETFISFSKRRAHYTILRIIGMTPSYYIKLVIGRILLIFVQSVILFLIGSQYGIRRIWGSFFIISEFFDSKYVICEIILALIIIATIVICVYCPLTKKYVVKYRYL